MQGKPSKQIIGNYPYEKALFWFPFCNLNDLEQRATAPKNKAVLWTYKAQDEGGKCTNIFSMKKKMFNL